MPIEKLIDDAHDAATNAVEAGADALRNSVEAGADTLQSGVEGVMDWFANVIDPPSNHDPEPDSSQSNSSNCPPCGK